MGQKLAWGSFQQQDVLFLSGIAGVGKTHIAMAFAINEILQKQKKRIILTRPIVEAGESLGYLPGNFQEKVDPYMRPLYDCLNRLVGYDGPQRLQVESSIEIAPIAYLRGRTFNDAVCIFDEAQNATFMQLKLFLTRLGENSKLIITGDPTQSDIGDKSGFQYIMDKLANLPGVASVKFDSEHVVRHSLVSAMIERLSQ